MAAKYRQLADFLRSEAMKILEGGGDRMPTEMEISSRYSVSRQTVRNALHMLEEEGLIERRQGSGSYIKPQKNADDLRQIALVTTFIDDYIFPTILHDAQSIFAKNGYSTLVYATENSVGRERDVLTELLGKNISAILIEGSRSALPTPNAGLFASFRRKGIPVVFLHGMYSNLPDFPCVLDDNFSGGFQAAQYLIDKGHSRIAGIFKSDDAQGPERYHGVVSAMTDSQIRINDSRFCWYDTEDRKSILSGEPESLTKLSRFIDEELGSATAIICYNDEIAYSAIQIILKHGKTVPEDVAIVSFDNSFYSQIGSVPITSLGHKAPRSGVAAAELLIGMLKENKTESMNLRWELISRQSG